jgi:hypothetical protein
MRHSPQHSKSDGGYRLCQSSNRRSAPAGDSEQRPRTALPQLRHISFLVIKRRQVGVAFAFDADFTSAGFALFDE